MNSYEDDPPPYPGLAITANIRPTTTCVLPKRLPRNHNQTISISNNGYSSENTQRVLQAQKWKSSDNQQRICYIGDLPDDFLRMEFSLNSEGINRKLSTDIQSDQSISSTSYHFSTKGSTRKASKVRAQMLQTFLTQIEQGQTMKTSMVPEEPITQHDDYSHGKDALFTNY